jgi:hypothetical protein
MDGFVLAAGIVTSGLSLGAGIWQSVSRSPKGNADDRVSSGLGALRVARDQMEGAFGTAAAYERSGDAKYVLGKKDMAKMFASARAPIESNVDAVVVNGELRPLTTEQRDAVLQVLGEHPAA